MPMLSNRARDVTGLVLALAVIAFPGVSAAWEQLGRPVDLVEGHVYCLRNTSFDKTVHYTFAYYQRVEHKGRWSEQLVYTEGGRIEAGEVKADVALLRGPGPSSKVELEGTQDLEFAGKVGRETCQQMSAASPMFGAWKELKKIGKKHSVNLTLGWTYCLKNETDRNLAFRLTYEPWSSFERGDSIASGEYLEVPVPNDGTVTKATLYISGAAGDGSKVTLAYRRKVATFRCDRQPP